MIGEVVPLARNRPSAADRGPTGGRQSVGAPSHLRASLGKGTLGVPRWSRHSHLCRLRCVSVPLPIRASL